MLRRIQDGLDDMERRHDIRILYACESGSRAWGFPSPDSDWDVRFIYTYDSAEKYLEVEERPDHITPKPDAVMDFVGMELRKALRLMRGGNAKIFEWMQSPIKYRNGERFCERLLDLAPAYFSARTGLHHYLGLARQASGKPATETVLLKSYFYELRSLLAARFIADTGACPPMTFEALRKPADESGLGKLLDDLLALKTGAGEDFHAARNGELDAFLDNCREMGEAAARNYESHCGPVAPLNQFFQQIIFGHDDTRP